MSGTYFDPQVKKAHRCKLPSPLGWQLGRPSGWRCECGKAYVLTPVGQRDTQLGELPYQWRRAPEHDTRRQP